MARVWMEGFESGFPHGHYLESWDNNRNTLFFDDVSSWRMPETIKLRKGRSIYSKYCIEFDGSNINSQRIQKTLPDSYSEVYARAYFKFVCSNHTHVMRDTFSLRGADNLTLLTLYNEGGGSSTGDFSVTARIGGTYTARHYFTLHQDIWYKIEYYYKQGSSSNGAYKVWIDDVLIFEETNINLNDEIAQVCLRGSTFDSENLGLWKAYYDDVAVNDTTGSINNQRCCNGTILAVQPKEQGIRKNSV